MLVVKTMHSYGYDSAFYFFGEGNVWGRLAILSITERRTAVRRKASGEPEITEYQA